MSTDEPHNLGSYAAVAQDCVSDTRLQADVSWSLDRVSSAQAKLGDIPGAELALIEAIGLREGLHNRDPKDIDWLRDLGGDIRAIRAP